MKLECEKCKQKVEELWLTVSMRKDGSTKEVWICNICAKKIIQGFEEIEQNVADFEKAR